MGEREKPFRYSILVASDDPAPVRAAKDALDNLIAAGKVAAETSRRTDGQGNFRLTIALKPKPLADRPLPSFKLDSSEG